MNTVFTRSFLLMTLLTLCNFTLIAQQPEWVRGGGTASSPAHSEASYSICTDVNGNIYSLNEVGTGAVHADSFSSILPSSGSQNILVTSYNCEGQMRWAKVISSSSDNGFVPYTIKADNSGHIYVAANLSRLGSLQIGSDTSIIGLTNEVQALIQFDTAGHFSWIRFVGDNTPSSTGISGDFYSFLAIDGNNIVHYFNGLNAGVHITPTLTSLTGTYDISYSPSGALLRAKRLDLDSSLDMYGAAIDHITNKIYGFGMRKYNLTTPYGGDSSAYAFVAAFDTGDNRIWIDTAGSTLTQNMYFCGVDVDNHGHVYYAMFSFVDIVYRGDTLYPYPGAGTVELFSFMKMDTAANLLWTSMVGVSGSSGQGTFNCMSLLPTNKIALTAGFEGTISDGITSYISPDYRMDPFLYITDTGGHSVALKQLHGDGDDGGFCITSDNKGNVYIGGGVQDSIPTSLVPEYLTVGGPSDFFVFKYGIPCDCPAFPVASFNHTGSITVNFTYTGTTSGIDSVRWHFGDGSTSTAFSPAHTYTAAGTYSASITIYSPCGGDIFYDSIRIPCVAPPVAAYTDTGLSLTKHFAYTGATYGLDSVVWHFGDGGHATGINATHTYAVGTYTACAIAYNPCGSNSVCHTVTVINCAGLPSASYTQTGTTATRSFTYTGPAAYVDSVVWHFGDGGHAVGTTASHTYSSIGTFTACVSVYSPCGFDSACSSVTVPCLAAPIATFTATGTSPTRSFAYTGTTTGIDSIVWHFGDGAHATGSAVSHTYSATGTYTACVLPYNHCGVDSICHTVNISCITAPTAALTDTGTYVIGYTYTGTTIGVDSIVWNYGDGSTGSGSSNTHTYSHIGTYNVCATAYSGCGSNIACHSVTITCNSPIVASFTHTGVTSVHFAYTGTTAFLDSVKWSFGDGTMGSGVNSTHGYDTSGTYHVCEYTYTDCGVDSACSNISVIGLGVNNPSASLTNVTVFPNPSTDELNIIGIQNSTNYRLLNIAGSMMANGRFEKGENVVALKELVPGIYILELVDVEGSKLNFRVVKE